MAKLLGGTRIYGNATIDTDLSVSGNVTTSNITANVWRGIYSSNVIETAGNLYFTNTRTVNAVTNTNLSNITVTGNVVSSNVIAQNMYVGTALFLQNINVTSNILTGTVASSNSYSTSTVTDTIYANTWLNLYTANVVETAGNLYYTNTRVYANTIALLPTLAGTGISISANGVISATGNITGTISTALANLTTANIAEAASNLYYTNARVYSNVISALPTYTGNSGSILTTSSQPYITTVGTLTNLTVAGNIQSNSWVGLYTSNVIETASNLYFTNARTINAITNTTLSNITISGNVIAGNLITGAATSNIGGSIVGANLISTNYLYANNIITGSVNNNIGGAITGANLVNTNYLVASNITANTWIGIYTANVIESNSNLYYTNSRVYSNTIALLPTLAGTGISISAGGVISATANVSGSITGALANLTTANITEASSNLYFTNARVYSNVLNLLPTYTGNSGSTLTTSNQPYITALGTLSNLSVTGNISTGNIITGLGSGGSITGGNLLSATNIQGNIWAGIYTANVIETASNLYFTNNRAATAVVNSQLSNITVTGNIIAGNIITQGIILQSINVTSNILTGGSVNTAQLAAGNINASNIISNTITSNIWSGIYTSNVIETASNLYFTNARTTTAVVNSQLSNISVTGNTSTGNVITTGYIVASNGLVAVNAYPGPYTHGIVVDYVTSNGRISMGQADGLNIYNGGPGNILIASISSTGGFTSNTITTGNIYAGNLISGVATSNIGGSIIGANLISTSYLYANNIITGTANNNTGGAITGANLISTNYLTASNITSNNWFGLYTANVIETAGNLFYSNARVYSNTIALLPTLAGTGISISAGGVISATGNITASLSGALANLTTANVAEAPSNLYYTNSRVASYLSNLDVNFGNVTVFGNLYIKGDINEINTNVLYVDDKTITIAKNTPTAALADQSGLIVDGANASIIYTYNSGNDKFVINKGIDVLNGTINATNISATTWTGIYTANVSESASNLYYTNSRVYSNVISALPTYTGNSGSTLTTGNQPYITSLGTLANLTVTGNITAGNIFAGSGGSIVGGNLISTNNIQANTWLNLYTANVVETANNLYFTNTRAATAVVNSQLSNITVTGNVVAGNIITQGIILQSINVTSNILTGGSINTANLVAGNINASNILANYISSNTLAVSGNITAVGTYFGGPVQSTVGLSSPLMVLTSNTAGYTQIQIQNISSSNSASSDFVATANNGTDTTNYIDMGINNSGWSSNAWTISGANDGYLYVDGGNLTLGTDTVNKNVSIHVGGTLANNIVATFAANGLTVSSNITTGNIITNSIITGNLLATSNIGGYIIGANNIQTYNLNASNIYTSNLYAGNIISGTLSSNVGGFIVGANLISTNYLFANILSVGNTTSSIGGSITGVNVITTNYLTASNITSNNWFGLYTANVSESASNLYFTNSRVYSNTIALLPTLAGTGISINANGIISATANVSGSISGALANLTTANISEASSNLYYTNARVANYIQTANLDVNFGNITVNGNLYVKGNVYEVFSNSLYIVDKTITVAKNTPTATLADQSGLIVDGANASILYNYNAGNDKFVINKGIDVYNGTVNATNISATTWTGIYTANVSESASNLYFTNNRAVSAVTNTTLSNITVAGNVIAGNIITQGIVLQSINVTSNILTGGSVNTANLVAGNVNASNILANFITSNTLSVSGNINANNITSNIWNGLYTANVIETSGNLYFTNARVNSVIQNYTGNLNAGNIITNSIVSGNLSSNIGGYITGANLISTYNLSASNIYVSNIYSGNIISGSATSNVGGFIVGANLIQSSYIFANILNVGNTTATIGGSISGVNTIISTYVFASNVIANSWSGLYTSNVIETAGNLFYSNSRVYSNTIALLPTLAGTGISINANGIISATANITASLSGLTTANIAEAASNLYYTNARAQAAISGGTGVTYYNANGQINIGQDVSTSANVTFGTVNVRGALNIYGNVNTYGANNLSISDNMIYLNSNSTYSNPDLGFAGNYNDGTYHHAGFFRDALDKGTWKVFENYSPEPDSNIFINTSDASFRLANLAATTFFGNVTGQVSTISNFSTTNLVEGTNLYFTNTRVYSNVTTLLPTYTGNSGLILTTSAQPYITSLGTLTNLAVTGNISAGNILVANSIYLQSVNVTSNILTGGTINTNNLAAGNINASNITSNIWSNLYTANVIETASNLYFTNARVYSNVTSLLPTYTGNSGSILTAGNQPYITTLSNITVNGNLFATGNLITSGTLVANNISTGNATSNIGGTISGANLISTNYLVANTIITGTANNNTGGAITGANLVSTNYLVASNITSNTWIGIYTANVTESASNLYFTNARAGIAVATTQLSNITVTGNVVAGNIITNGIILQSINVTSNILTGGSVNTANLVAGNVNAGNVNSLNWINLYTANVIETAGNLYFTNSRVYSNVIGFLPSLAGTGISITANGIITATGNIAASLANLTTANVTESASNLYFTNARVYSNVIALLPTYTGNAGSILTTGNQPYITTLSNITVLGVLTANNISTGNAASNIGGTISGANLISTNYIYANNIITGTANNNTGGSITGANLISTVSLVASNINVGNVFVANTIYLQGANVTGNILSGGAINTQQLAAGNINAGNITANGWINLYTANVIETAGNLYFTNARVYSNVTSLLPTYTGNINAGNITANGWINLYTANVIETAGNLYFTNTRTYSNTIALLPTYTGNINASNVITGNLYVLSSIYLQSANVTGNILSGGSINTQQLAAGNINAGNVTANGLTINGNITSTGIYFGGPTQSTIGLANPLMVLTSNVNTYTQIQIQNINSGPNASSDFIATTNSGTDTTNYIDMGINNSGWSSNAWTISGANDGYLYVNSGNLTLGTDTVGKAVAIHVGGTLASNIVATFSANGLSLPGNVTTSYLIANTIVTGNATSTIGGSLVGANLISTAYLYANTAITIGNGGSITGANLITTSYLVANVITTGVYANGNIGGSLIGANLISTAYLYANTAITIGNGGSITGANSISTTYFTPNIIVASGSVGTPGQVLASNGSGAVYWVTPVTAAQSIAQAKSMALSIIFGS